MKRKILTAAVNILCVLAIVFSLLAGWSVISTPRGKAPKLFGISFMTVLTGSMNPTVPEHSLIVVRTIEPSEIKKDDIISFYARVNGSSGIINTHRVVEILSQNNELAFRTQGDANSVADPALVSEKNLIGKVVFHSFLLGQIVYFLCRPYVFLPMVLIPLLIIIFTYGRRIVRLAKEEIGKAKEELSEGDRRDDP